MVAAQVLETCDLCRVGSNPTLGTMKLNIYAVIIVVVNVTFSMFLMNKSKTYQTRSNDTIIQSDTLLIK